MNIGIPKERRDLELRVGLTPYGVELLTRAGHLCYVETGAGLGAGFTDYHYERAGAHMVYSGEETYGRADMVLKAVRPTDEELSWVREGQILAGFLHLAAARRSKVQILLERRVTAIAYETVEEDDGTLPILRTMSEVAGRMAPQLAATLLQSNHGGRGVLLSGVPGIPAATVAILGAGVLGTNAGRAFLGLGANVVMLDRSLERLRQVDEEFHGQVTTMVSYPFNIARVARSAEVIIGSILSPGGRAPVIVTREMVRTMKKGAVILDFSIDQGGCVETSRPTTLRDPSFIDEGVVHFCVPNVPGITPRTATHAFNNAAWPFIQRIADVGLEAAVEAMPALARGIATHGGDILSKPLAAAWQAGS
ncbi:MAG: alanine dehydrogenase, partial [Anaerolineales bacterium]|nr:alanine dehydrogenase [Anaerolineales bacterium]